MTKKFKTNYQGDAQLSVWLPEPIVKRIYDDYEKELKRQAAAGELKSSFKEFIYNEFIKIKYGKK